MKLNRLFTTSLVAFLLVSPWFARGQNAAPAAPNSAAANADAAKSVSDVQHTQVMNSAKKIDSAGIAIAGNTTVSNSVAIQAVLLPAALARRVFGAEIANHYVVIQVTVDNRSEDAAFLLQSIFLDAKDWKFSGVNSACAASAGALSPAAKGPAATPSTPGASAGNAAAEQPPPSAYETATCPGQISSVESRVIRDELQDASVWSLRNGIVRAATLIGSVGAGVPAFASTHAVKYVSAYNGDFVPGLQVLWPDATVAQMNHVSDLGYQTNKIFPKSSADIVYAFFPLNRILTPGLARLFRAEPAMFISPAEIFLDDKIGSKTCFLQHYCARESDVLALRRTLLAMARVTTGASDASSLAALFALDCSDIPPASVTDSTPQGKQTACATAQRLNHLLNDISLSNIAVTVAGVMTVNAGEVPASLQSVSVDKGDNDPTVWNAVCTPVPATVTGRYLTDGQVSISKMTAPNVDSAKVTDYFDPQPFEGISAGSDDTTLHFNLQLKNSVPSGSTLYFQVSKTDSSDKSKQAATVKSMEYQYPVSYVGGTAAKKDSTACKDRTKSPAGGAGGTAGQTPNPALAATPGKGA